MFINWELNYTMTLFDLILLRRITGFIHLIVSDQGFGRIEVVNQWLLINNRLRTTKARHALDTEKPNPIIEKKRCAECQSRNILDAKNCWLCNNSSFESNTQSSNSLDFTNPLRKSSSHVNSDLKNQVSVQHMEGALYYQSSNKSQSKDKPNWPFTLITLIIISIMFQFRNAMGSNLGLYCLVIVTNVLLWTINNLISGDNRYSVESFMNFTSKMLAVFFSSLLLIMAVCFAFFLICLGVMR